MTEFRIDTDTGKRYFVEAEYFSDALFAAGHMAALAGHEKGRIISLWYRLPESGEWVSGDQLIGR